MCLPLPAANFCHPRERFPTPVFFRNSNFFVGELCKLRSHLAHRQAKRLIYSSRPENSSARGWLGGVICLSWVLQSERVYLLPVIVGRFSLSLSKEDLKHCGGGLLSRAVWQHLKRDKERGDAEAQSHRRQIKGYRRDRHLRLFFLVGLSSEATSSHFS